MKHKPFPVPQNPKLARTARAVTAEKLDQSEIDFAGDADEVARRAYFSYVNQGSPSGRAVQHWLEAEAELIAERNLTRVHGFPHPPEIKTHHQPNQSRKITEV
ncbi:MAG: DUF2934 domain-containing protein [Akkermansiaceae bacterium]|nr:DUF2934 domain-containing protein [Verrucomicrobiales bacterium]